MLSKIIYAVGFIGRVESSWMNLAKHSAEAIRYFLISSHYRSDMNYSNEQLTEASVSLNRLYSALKGVQPEPDLASYGAIFEDHFHQAMQSKVLSYWMDVMAPLGKWVHLKIRNAIYE